MHYRPWRDINWYKVIKLQNVLRKRLCNYFHGFSFVIDTNNSLVKILSPSLPVSDVDADTNFQGPVNTGINI